MIHANPHVDDNHFVPQVEFARLCDYVIDFANLDEELEYVVSVSKLVPRKLFEAKCEQEAIAEDQCGGHQPGELEILETVLPARHCIVLARTSPAHTIQTSR